MKTADKLLFHTSIKAFIPLQIYGLLLLFLFINSCNGQDKTTPVEQPKTNASGGNSSLVPEFYGLKPDYSQQISQYVRRVFQDKAGNIWFGTQGNGVGRYDGKSLVYFTPKDGFDATVVRGILEDKSGNLWFATNNGVVRYDPKGSAGSSFTGFTVKDGLSHNDVWSISEDKKGTVWVGTMGGVCCYDPKQAVEKSFKSFPIPEANVEIQPRFSRRLAWSILEDNEGNLWFGMDGDGVRKYDPRRAVGKMFTIFTNKDGLADNNISSILQDKKGNLWFGTRNGGVSRYDGKSFTNFSERDGICYNFIWTMTEDKKGNIWFGSAGGGMSRYDGKSFTNFNEKNGLFNKHVQSIFEDKSGKLLLGTSGGAFRYDGKSFFNITKKSVTQL